MSRTLHHSYAVTGLAQWASALVNDDVSGLSDDDTAACDAWFAAIVAEHPYASAVYVSDVGPEFDATFDRKLSTCASYTINVISPMELDFTLPKASVETIARALLHYEQFCQVALKEAKSSGALAHQIEYRRRALTDAKGAREDFLSQLPGNKGR